MLNRKKFRAEQLLLIVTTFFCATVLLGCSLVNRNQEATTPPTRAPARPATIDGQAQPGSSTGGNSQTQAPRATTTDDDDTVTSDDVTPGATTNRAAIPKGRSRVVGRVTDPQGNPIASAAVTVPKGTSLVPEMAALTNANGEYSWSLPPGTFTIQVNADGYKQAQAEVNTEPDKESNLDFQLERQ